MPENIFDPSNWTRFGSYGIDISRYLKQSAWRNKKRNKMYQKIKNYYHKKIEKNNIKLAQIANKNQKKVNPNLKNPLL